MEKRQAGEENLTIIQDVLEPFLNLQARLHQSQMRSHRRLCQARGAAREQDQARIFRFHSHVGAFCSIELLEQILEPHIARGQHNPMPLFLLLQQAEEDAQMRG